MQKKNAGCSLYILTIEFERLHFQNFETVFVKWFKFDISGPTFADLGQDN